MRNQVFAAWDEVCGEIDEFTLPKVEQDTLNALPDSTPTRVVVDLADVWRAEEIKTEIGYERTHLTASNGTHLLIAKFGQDKTYAIAWHPTDQDAQKDALTAYTKEGEIDEEEPEDLRLADLIQEIAQKYHEATTF